jgi:hypothetical protein
MFCPKCGQQNDDNAYKCTKCGQILQGPPPGMAPGGLMPGTVPNHLVWAILATLFCCLPFGIVSIVYASQVNGKLAAGDMGGALESSGKAKFWAWLSFGLGLAVFVVYFIIGMIGVLSGQQHAGG